MDKFPIVRAEQEQIRREAIIEAKKKYSKPFELNEKHILLVAVIISGGMVAFTAWSIAALIASVVALVLVSREIPSTRVEVSDDLVLDLDTKEEE